MENTWRLESESQSLWTVMWISIIRGTKKLGKQSSPEETSDKIVDCRSSPRLHEKKSVSSVFDPSGCYQLPAHHPQEVYRLVEKRTSCRRHTLDVQPGFTAQRYNYSRLAIGFLHEGKSWNKLVSIVTLSSFKSVLQIIITAPPNNIWSNNKRSATNWIY